MLTFYNIADIDFFFQVIDACAGGILLQMEDGRYVDIRRNALIKHLLKMTAGPRGVDKLDVTFECAEDQARLFRYLMECRRERAAC